MRVSGRSSARASSARRRSGPRAVALGAVEQLVDFERGCSRGRAARRGRARAGPRCALTRRGRSGSRGTDLLAQLDDDALRGSLADPGRGLKAGRRRPPRPPRAARAQARRTGPRARPWGRPTGPRSASGTARAPLRWRIRTAPARRRGRRDGCGGGRPCRRRARAGASRPRPRAGSRRRRSRRRRGRRGARPRSRTPSRSRSRSRLVAAGQRASGARLSSQIATASASAAWSGDGGSDRPSRRATMRPT